MLYGRAEAGQGKDSDMKTKRGVGVGGLLVPMLLCPGPGTACGAFGLLGTVVPPTVGRCHGQADQLRTMALGGCPLPRG